MPERLGQYVYWSVQTADAPEVALLRRRATAAAAPAAAAAALPGSGPPADPEPAPVEVLLDCNDPEHVPPGCQLAQVRMLLGLMGLGPRRDEEIS